MISSHSSHIKKPRKVVAVNKQIDDREGSQSCKCVGNLLTPIVKIRGDYEYAIRRNLIIDKQRNAELNLDIG